MKKEELIAKLDAAKEITTVVSIDTVVELIKQLEPETKTTLTPQFASELLTRINKTLDYNSEHLVDKDSAEFELCGNEISLSEVYIDLDQIMERINAVIDEYTNPEDEDEDAQTETPSENSVEE
jgi:hypothetical protein